MLEKPDILPRYSVYGVTLASDFPFALPPADDSVATTICLRGGSGEEFDSIRRNLPPAAPDEHRQHLVLEDGSVYMRWDDWLEFIVSHDGQRVDYARSTHGPLDSLEAYIGNFAVSAALVQQGEEPLHATVVEFGDRAVGFLGPSGAGKSTLAAFLLSQGAGLVTDDMLRITFENGLVCAEPGPLRLKLFEEPAARYLQTATCRGRWNPLAGKFLFEPGDPRASRNAHPLAALFWLEVPHVEETTQRVRLDRLDGLELFKTISASTMNSRLNTPKRLARQFRFATRIGELLPVYRLAYQRRYEVFGEVAELLKAPTLAVQRKTG